MSFNAAHIYGRWLNVLLNAEEVLGIKIDDSIVENLRKWAIKVFENNIGLPACIDLELFEPVKVSDLNIIIVDKEYLFRDKRLIFRWRGDEVIDSLATGKRLCFFQDI